MKLFKAKEFTIGCIASSIIGVGIGIIIGRRQGTKIGYNMAVEEVKETEVNESECNRRPESNAPEQEETVAEIIENITESEDPECKTEEELEEESEEIIETLRSTGIEWIKEKDVQKYVDGFDYSMENFYFYPEDPDICDTLVAEEGVMDMEELETAIGENDITHIRGLFDEMADRPEGPETLYIVNHDNMCIYTIECFPGLRGGIYKDYREEDEQDYKSYLNNYPELV